MNWSDLFLFNSGSILGPDPALTDLHFISCSSRSANIMIGIRCISIGTMFFIAIGTSAQSLQWARSISAAGQEIAYSVAVDGTGAVITVGTFIVVTDLDPGPGIFNVTPNGSSDIFIQKLDADGLFLWGGSIGAANADVPYGVAIDADNNIVITGTVHGTLDIDPTAGSLVLTTNSNSYDVLVVKLGPGGTFLWGRLFGGLANDTGRGITADASGNVVTVGVIGAAADLDPGIGVATVGGNGMQDAFVQKMDPNGNFLWGHAVGGTANDLAYAVAVDNAGAVHVTGEFRNTMDLDPGAGVQIVTSAGAEDIFNLKLNSSGTWVWGHRIGGTSSERSRSIAAGNDGSVVITGRLMSATDMDPGPGSFVLPASFFEDAFVLKLAPDATFIWAFLLESFINEGLDLAVDQQHNVYVTGVFGGTLDIDPGQDTLNIISNGASDIFLISYSASGALNWGMNIGSGANDIGNTVALSPTNSIHIAGEFRNTMDMDPGGNTMLLTATMQDGFVAKYDKPDCEGVFVQLKAILDGPFDPTAFPPWMNADLRQAGLIPLNEPYTAMGHVLEEPATTTTNAFVETGGNALVDWVVVELRDPADPATVIAARAGFIQRDGDVVAVDGVGPVGFCVGSGMYHVALRHRNHLGVMTADPVALANPPITIDLRDPGTVVFGTNARRDHNGTMVLWAGNVTTNNFVSYTGANNDRDPILAAIGGVVPTDVASGYMQEDVNLDGLVKYTGPSNDRDRVLITIGGIIPTATRVEQLP